MLDGEVKFYGNRQWVVSNRGITSISGVNCARSLAVSAGAEFASTTQCKAE